MPYFNLMSAINLYVAVDWQGDREIERAGGRLQRERRGARGDAEKERNPELRRTKQEEGRKEGMRERERERRNIHKHATDTPPFLLIEIQFERSKPGNSEEIELSRYYREPAISTRCLYRTYEPRVLYIETTGLPRNARETAMFRE